MSSRRLRYFTVLAEELHFSRAAARLFMTQQALSKQLRELEAEVGAKLVHRTTRSVALTEAGAVFAGAAREALAVIDAGVTAARRAHGVTPLRLGFLIGAAMELTTPLLRAFAARHPAVRLDLHEYGFATPSAGLADGSSDIALLRLPLATTGLTTVPLFTEPLVAVLPAGHPLAARPTVTAAEVAAEQLVMGASPDPVWRGYWTLDAHRPPATPRRVLDSATQSEEVEMVAAGVAVTVTVAGLERYVGRGGLRYVPIEDAPGSTLALAWRETDGGNPAVRAFVETALAVRDEESELVAMIEAGGG
ncbi:LysR family transcriptional regulator [Actinorhabdospora filicis]|uniref:LysR family transcriptional regulator n=1 Tax=Actinorhabdospora filicis TaxID=1785913 RepID=A0A9W6ST12_9ACTN|nr:LysR family transcriptional regulator [Actinorhabdospora filicis]GLZ81538.1 LysR family transcriptional regulator [Actinorhabdospora filicis]